MILDRQLLLSENQDLSQNTGTYVSTNTIDLLATGVIPGRLGGLPVSDIGRGNAPELLVQVTETFTSGTSSTVQAQLITSATDNLGSPTVIASTAAIAHATLVAGYQFRLAVPPGIAQRYLGVQYVIGGAATTAGTVTAGIVLDKQTNPTV